jgi:hypothetical protein
LLNVGYVPVHDADVHVPVLKEILLRLEEDTPGLILRQDCSHQSAVPVPRKGKEKEAETTPYGTLE